VNADQATELLSLSALAHLPAHSSEARLICEAVISACSQDSNARHRAGVFLNLMTQQLENQQETQAEFTALLQTTQTQLKLS
jgi:hypothetical protein